MQPAAALAREPAPQPLPPRQRHPDPPESGEGMRLLVVEDSPLDYELLLATLQREGIDVQSQRVQTAQQLAEALESRRWDAVISDHQLQDLSGQQAIELVRARQLHCPFIIVSSVTGEDVAVVAMRRGADDYLVKGRLARLVPALFNAIATADARRERAEAREALLQSEAQLRELLAHLETVVDDERREIAREIHDEIGSSLTALRLDMNWIGRNGDAASADRAQQAMQTLSQVMDTALRLQQRLRPAVLDQGFDAALRWLADDAGRRSDLTVTFQSNAEAVAVPAPAALAAYRTLQESLNNVIKHARASRVDISLVVGEDQLSLEVVDNGRGIQVAERQKPTSFGLRGMSERAERLGGWIEVSSLCSGAVAGDPRTNEAAGTAASGTVVFLSLPMASSPVPVATSASGGTTSPAKRP
jgi:signal transduction histidine kinase